MFPLKTERERKYSMEIKKRQIEGYLVFDLMEDITYENAKELDSYVMENMQDDSKKVVLNIKSVVYVNSFALSVLIKTMQEVEKSGCEFYLMNVNHAVESLLEITGVLSKFRIMKE